MNNRNARGGAAVASSIPTANNKQVYQESIEALEAELAVEAAASDVMEEQPSPPPYRRRKAGRRWAYRIASGKRAGRRIGGAGVSFY